MHNQYDTIDIRLYDYSSQLINRELLTYSDIFQIFNNFFIYFNENMQKIYEFINKCIIQKNYEIKFENNNKYLSLELYILTEKRLQAKKICLYSYLDKNGSDIISQKIKDIKLLKKIPSSNSIVAPFTNQLKYETNSYILNIKTYYEPEIELIAFKIKLIEKNSNNNNNNINDNDIYCSYYIRPEIDSISKNYFENYSLKEILDNFKLIIANKNIKIDIIPNKKIKIQMILLSNCRAIQLNLEFIKGYSIKQKYIQILKDLKEENEALKFENNLFNSLKGTKIKNANNNKINHDKYINKNNNDYINNNNKINELLIINDDEKIISLNSNENKFLENKRGKSQFLWKKNHKGKNIEKENSDDIKIISDKIMKEAKRKNNKNKIKNKKDIYNLRKNEINSFEESEESILEKFILIDE